MSPSRTELTQICYEMAMAINDASEQSQMLKQTLTTMVRKLNCCAGGIHLLNIEPDRAPGFYPAATVPRNSVRIASYAEALAQLPQPPSRDALDQFSGRLPLSGSCLNGDRFYFFDLLPHGFLLLLKCESSLDSVIIKELQPIISRLTQAIGTCRQREALQESIDHLSMVSDELRHYQESLEEMVEIRTAALQQEMVERRLAEDEFRHSEERHQLFLQQLPDPVAVFNRQCVPLYLNKAFSKTFGWALDDFSPQKCPLLCDESGEKGEWLRQKIARGETLAGFEISLQNHSREVLRVAVSGIPISQAGGTESLQILVLRDVTEQHRLEGHLRHSQKMQAIGTLTGGIAHDFNNLLQAISGYTQLLQRRVESESREESFLESIAISTERAADLVRQLLIASRRGESQLQPIDLNETVEQASKLLERTLIKMVRIEKNLSDEPLIINGDPAQFEQVLLNLANNAQAAMPKGGVLTFSTEKVELDESFCQARDGILPGIYVLLRVVDNGSGMSPQVLEHIFEPFFTTKEIGEGTGLGLSSAYGVVRNHKGMIECCSEIGKGTVFSIYLPLVSEYPPVQPRPADYCSLPTGEETLLIVDDELSVADFARSALEEGGYRILQAATGEEALELYLGKSREISLVILDLNMPGMGGEKCLETLRVVDPEVRVLVASGYATKEQAQCIIDLGAAGFIGKPYRIEAILKEVRLAIDGK